MCVNDDNDGAGSPLFTFVDENTFKKETFLGKCTKKVHFLSPWPSKVFDLLCLK